MIAALVALVWLDDAVTGAGGWQLPAGLGWLNPREGTLPAGTVLLILGMLVCGRAGVELARMFNAVGIAASWKHLASASAAGVLVGGLTIGRAHLGPWPAEWAGTMQATAIAGVVFLSMLAYIRDRDVKGTLGAVAAAVLAFAYTGVVIGFLLAIRREQGVWVMASVVLVIKLCDIGALFTGLAIGKHKLIEWISPKKTWEGFVGGVLTSGVAAVVLLLIARSAGESAASESLRAMPLWLAGVLGVVLGAAGQAGDLSESVLKRDAGMKDSGRIVPGFGGVVDVLDSLVLAGPLAYWGLMAASWV